MYANVIVEITSKSVDKMFTYLIPKQYLNLIKVGSRVKVPFGKTTLEGFVFVIVSFVAMCAVTFCSIWVMKKVKIVDFLFFGKQV